MRTKSEWPTITMQDGRVIKLINGVDTGVKVPDEAAKDCFDAIAKSDYEEARRRCFVHALKVGLPAELPLGRHYSFGNRLTFTVVP